MKSSNIFFILLLFAVTSCNLQFGFVSTNPALPFNNSVSDQYKANIIRLKTTQLVNLIESNSDKVILLHLWASWCKPCVQELPDIRLLSDKYYDKGLFLILLSNDFKSIQQEQVIKGILVESGVSFDTYITDISTFKKIINIDGSASKMFKHITSEYEGGVPFNFIFDKSGRVVFEKGLTPYDTLESIILPLLVSDTNSPW